MTGGECRIAMVNRNYQLVVDRLLEEGNTDDTGEDMRRKLALRCLAVCLARLDRLEQSVEVASELIALQDPSTLGARDLCERAASLWRLSKYEDAVADWRRAFTCKYGDGAGNILPVLQLYYAAVRLEDEGLLSEAIAALSKSLSTGWSKNWPAPLGRFLIGSHDEGSVEREILDEHPARQPDEWCRFDFYRGVKCLVVQDLAAAMAHFESALQRPNQVTWTVEFVLAMHECNRFGCVGLSD